MFNKFKMLASPKSLCFVFASIVLSACVQTNETEPSMTLANISVYTSGGSLIAEYTDETSREVALRLLSERKKTAVKLLPMFNHKIVITNGSEENKNETWLINAAGYLQQESDRGQLYIIENPNFFLKPAN